jgi:hypothetical protein
LTPLPPQWDKVAEELANGRTAGQCLAHWLRLRGAPSRSVAKPKAAQKPRHKWSPEDDELLQVRGAGAALRENCAHDEPLLRGYKLQLCSTPPHGQALLERHGNNWVTISDAMGHKFDRHQVPRCGVAVGAVLQTGLRR